MRNFRIGGLYWIFKQSLPQAVILREEYYLRGPFVKSEVVRIGF